MNSRSQGEKRKAETGYHCDGDNRVEDEQASETLYFKPCTKRVRATVEEDATDEDSSDEDAADDDASDEDTNNEDKIEEFTRLIRNHLVDALSQKLAMETPAETEYERSGMHP